MFIGVRVDLESAPIVFVVALLSSVAEVLVGVALGALSVSVSSSSCLEPPEVLLFPLLLPSLVSGASVGATVGVTVGVTVGATVGVTVGASVDASGGVTVSVLPVVTLAALASLELLPSSVTVGSGTAIDVDPELAAPDAAAAVVSASVELMLLTAPSSVEDATVLVNVVPCVVVVFPWTTDSFRAEPVAFSPVLVIPSGVVIPLPEELLFPKALVVPLALPPGLLVVDFVALVVVLLVVVVLLLLVLHHHG